MGTSVSPCPQRAQLGALLAPRAERVHVRFYRLNISNSRLLCLRGLRCFRGFQGFGRGDAGERAGLAGGLGAPKPGGGEGDAHAETLHWE